MYWLREDDSELAIEQLMPALAAGEFKRSNSAVLAFGIGSTPVWLAMYFDNPQAKTVSRRLEVAISWLDRLDFFVLRDGKILEQRQPAFRAAYGAQSQLCLRP